MFRNKEIKVFLTLVVSICLLGNLIIYKIDHTASIVSSFICILLLISFILFTKWRYQEIKKLSSYLYKICLGDYSLDLRTNAEGELSILKNDLYKVTTKLSEQAELLKKDKIHLANSISDISHQLKTPLTSMMVMTDLLRSSNLSEEKRIEFTNNINNQLERIQWLVTSLLKLSKIDAGTVIFKKESVNVKALIESSLSPLLIPIDIKEQTLNIVGDNNAFFIGDFNWTREAIINILKNCIEHTYEKGAINIKYSQNPIYTEIVIKDNGKGIDKKDIPYIFKRFYKGKNASDDSVGIGLAMSKTIIKKQNGDIKVKSEVGSYTEFIIKFYSQII